MNFRIDFNTAKRKYFGCFNNITSVIRQQINEIMVLKLIKPTFYHDSVWMWDMAHWNSRYAGTGYNLEQLLQTYFSDMLSFPLHGVITNEHRYGINKDVTAPHVSMYQKRYVRVPGRPSAWPGAGIGQRGASHRRALVRLWLVAFNMCFYSAVALFAMQSAVIATAILSVRLSVCLSHAGTLFRRMNTRSWGIS